MSIGELISRQMIDAAFVGIGESRHLAFNDPPADFETEERYLVIELDEECRLQQVGEGWFKIIKMGIFPEGKLLPLMNFNGKVFSQESASAARETFKRVRCCF